MPPSSSQSSSRISSRHISMASQSGFLSYRASHRNIIPPQPLSLRPISQATSIAVDSDYESYNGDALNKRVAGKGSQMAHGWRGNAGNIREEDEEKDGGVSEAESMESLSSRVQRVHDILSDSDASSTRHTRTSISSTFTLSEASTPEGSPLPHYHEPLIYDPDVKNSMLFNRSSLSNVFSPTQEDLPRYTKEPTIQMSTIGPKGPHLFRSLSTTSASSSAHNSLTQLIVPDGFIPPTPVTPSDAGESPSLMRNPSTPALSSQALALVTPPTRETNATPTPTTRIDAQQMVRSKSNDSEASSRSSGSNYSKKSRKAIESIREETKGYDIAEVRSWNEGEVCEWVRGLGFDEETVMKFKENDITGSLLTEMDHDVLKQCGIRSWGKRVELLSHISHLKSLSTNAINGHGNPIEQYAYIRHVSAPIGPGFGSPARPSPRSAMSAPTPRMPPIEQLQPVSMATVSEDDNASSRAPKPTSTSSSDDEGELTVSTRAPRLNIRKKSRKGRARVVRSRANKSRKQISIESLGSTEVMADSATDGEREYKIYRIVSTSSGRTNATSPIEKARQERRARRSKENSINAIAIPVVSNEPVSHFASVLLAEEDQQKKRKTCKKHGQNTPASLERNNNEVDTRPNTCSKGDRCPRHGKASKAKKALERGSLTSAGTILIATTPSIADDMSFPNLGILDSASATRPESLVAPSVVASSDVLGAVHSKEVRLQEGVLDAVSSIDPQENVKKFLVNQHLQHLEERRRSPPPVPTKSIEDIMRAHGSRQRSTSNSSSNSEIAAQAVAQATQQLQHSLPRQTTMSSVQQSLNSFLVPPSDAVQPGPVLTTPMNRAKTPSLGLRTTGIQPAPPSSSGFSPVARIRSPSVMRSTTPFSETDVLIGSPTPHIPDFRNQSQSVPPEFKYRNDPRSFTPGLGTCNTVGMKVAPAPPPPGTLPVGTIGPSRRMTSTTTGMRPQAIIMSAVEENAEWEDEPAVRSTSLDTNSNDTNFHKPTSSTSSTLSSKNNAATANNVASGVDRSIRVHSGWMRKRKTHWFRHEWPEHHFVLRGTRLGIHKDQHSAEEGHIDMDDYSVACSNSASTKLSAAFKAFRIKNGDNKSGINGSNAFFFQLVPVSDKERKAAGLRGGSKDKKAHYFAVKSRDERIDWMRELMLAKAIKQKKGEGYEVEVNGEKV